MMSSFLLNYSILLTCFVVASNGQTFHFGSCPRVAAKKDFDLSKFEGTWFEYSKNRRFETFYDMGLRCATETYTVNQDGSVRMINRGIRITFGKPFSEEGTGFLKSSGKLSFTFPTLPFFPQDVELSVVDTDYENYAVVWSCSNRARMRGQIAKVLTRVPDPDPMYVRKALEALDQNKIGRTSFIRTPQTACVYYERNLDSKK